MKRLMLDSPDDFILYREGSGGTIEIFDIAVGTERRKGRGRRLIEVLLMQQPPSVKLVWAITRADNFIAQQFYEALGFRVIAPLRNFYGVKTSAGHDTIDAIMYGRDL